MKEESYRMSIYTIQELFKTTAFQNGFENVKSEKEKKNDFSGILLENWAKFKQRSWISTSKRS